MINYTEKGSGLHQAIRQAGHWLREENGAWLSSDDSAVQALIDGYTLADAAAPIIAQVKALAYGKIVAFLPAWQQSNFNARMNELNEARFSRVLTADEDAEVEAMRSQWDRAKAIRAASNAHEANLAACASLADLLAYDITAGWP